MQWIGSTLSMFPGFFQDCFRAVTGFLEDSLRISHPLKVDDFKDPSGSVWLVDFRQFSRPLMRMLKDSGRSCGILKDPWWIFVDFKSFVRRRSQSLHNSGCCWWSFIYLFIYYYFFFLVFHVMECGLFRNNAEWTVTLPVSTVPSIGASDVANRLVVW